MSDEMASESEIAAERLVRVMNCRTTDEVHEIYGNHPLKFESIEKTTLAIDMDRKTTSDAYIARLAADRAERDDRARPIDAEWLESMFDEEFDEAFSSRSIMLGALVPACGRCGWTWVIGEVHVATVTTRGQLLDLLRVLKGGV